DLDALGFSDDVVIARRADNRAALQLPHHERQHVTGILAGERLRNVALGLFRSRHRGVPELPELAVGGGGRERIAMLARERLKAHAMAFKLDRARLLHRRRVYNARL